MGKTKGRALITPFVLKHFQTDFPEKQSQAGYNKQKTFQRMKKRRKDAPSVYKCYIRGQDLKENGQQVVWVDMYFVSLASSQN